MPPANKNDETTPLDTSKHVSPNEKLDSATPVFDEVAKELGVPEGALVDDPEFPSSENALNPNHLEDDDPLSLVGDFVDEDGDGVDDRKENA